MQRNIDMKIKPQSSSTVGSITSGCTAKLLNKVWRNMNSYFVFIRKEQYADNIKTREKWLIEHRQLIVRDNYGNNVATLYFTQTMIGVDYFSVKHHLFVA